LSAPGPSGLDQIMRLVREAPHDLEKSQTF
jgi:hypothetical protein